MTHRAWLLLLPVLLVGCATTQRITVNSEPSGAEVTLDGQPLGPTPTSFDDGYSGGGKYYALVLTKPGYQTRSVTLRQEQDNATVATSGFLRICCPCFLLGMLWADKLPLSSYSFALEPEGALPPQPLAPGPVPPNLAPPPRVEPPPTGPMSPPPTVLAPPPPAPAPMAPPPPPPSQP